MRLKPIALVAFLLLAPAVFAQSQESLIRELLDLPAPAKIQPEPGKTRRPESFFDEKKPPSDEAPIEDLIDYWSTNAARNQYSPLRRRASEAVALRIVAALRDEPEKLDSVVAMFPPNEDVARAVSDLFLSQPTTEYTKNRAAFRWLKFETDRYVDELFAEAQNARDHKEYSSVIKEQELAALANVDWDRALPILTSLSADKENPRTVALALTLLYKHAYKEDKDSMETRSIREKLISIATDRNASPYARSAAIEVLIEKEWSGRDEWHLSLFSDPSLQDMTEGSRLYRPVTDDIDKDPEKWIPILSGLLGNTDRTVHNAAVKGLMEIKTRESVIPLIPWLSDPSWAQVNYSPGGRNTLIQLVSKFKIVEAIPGLISILTSSEEDADEIETAARSVRSFRDERAGPALLAALSKVSRIDHRETIIDALIECNGITVEQQLEAIEALAISRIKPQQPEEDPSARISKYDDDKLPLERRIGLVLFERKTVSDHLVEALSDRIKSLRKTDPSLAAELNNILTAWEGLAAERLLLSKVDSSEVSVELVIQSLAKRKDLQKLTPELSAMLGKPGITGAVAACILEDKDLIFSSFASTDRETSASAMACARLLRLELPTEDVARLLNSEDKLLALAADRYLEVVDTPRSREILLQNSKEFRILGARSVFDPVKKHQPTDFRSAINQLLYSVGSAFTFADQFADLDEHEERLRMEFATDENLLHVYATLSNYATGATIIRVYKDRVTMTVEDDKARVLFATMTKAEVDDLNRRLHELDLENFYAKEVYCHHDCSVREFVSLSRKGGRRIFSGYRSGSLGMLDTLFWNVSADRLKIQYKFMVNLPGAVELFSSSTVKPVTFWKHGDDLRILVEDTVLGESIREQISAADRLDDANDDLTYSERFELSRARRNAREYEHYHWNSVREGKLADLVAEPDEVPFLTNLIQFSAPGGYHRLSKWQTRFGNEKITSLPMEKGLWAFNGANRRLVAKGLFDHELVVNGHWLLAAKGVAERLDNRYLVRIDLRTNKEYRVPIDVGDLTPVAFISAHNKFLAVQKNTVGERTYYLIDPANGRSEIVKGEFGPYHHQRMRPLQKASGEHQYWATINDVEKNQTRVGLYDTRTFTFVSKLTLSDIVVLSHSVWVDEASNEAFFVYETPFDAALFRVPLPKP